MTREAMFFALVLGHCVADYPLQTDWMAHNKHRNSGPMWPYVLTAHAGTHAAAVWIITGSPILAAAELVCHWIIDLLKCEARTNIGGPHA